MCLAAWPSNESEADAKLVLIEISYVNDFVLMLISRNLNETSSDVSIKTRSTAASFSFKGLAPVVQTMDSAIHRINRYPLDKYCLLYTSPSPRDGLLSRMPSSA